ncbi:unnamed protein product [Dracunculus medinensis]|uniref:Uncharacterized protein n=1 Tax=Dracunculus medinensis TaxID=318479 RepID=A0A0N4UJE8_DRAME|nr:unnamed protein product [Dracunculus medinensis]
MIIYLSDRCELPKNNPWDPSIVNFLHPKYEQSNCILKPRLTELLNGQLVDVSNETTECNYRCLYVKGEKGFRTDPWTTMAKNLTYNVTCDFVETQCSVDSHIFYRYIHIQVLKSKTKHFQAEDKLNPSILMVIHDSTSLGSGIRTLVRSNEFLPDRRYYGDITMRRFFTIITRLVSTVGQMLTLCLQVGLNENETVTYDFIRKKYATFVADEWCCAFTWPNCYGYKNPQFDHYAAPLIGRVETKKVAAEFAKSFFDNDCQSKYHKIIEYSEKFVKTYDGVAKFVVVWFSFAHNDLNSLYPADKYFADFFENNIEQLKGSFIFWMADHGLRFGGPRQTKAGFIEDNNPFLAIAVPEYLRSNAQLLLNMRRNSKRHTSQYDIFATLYDIANVAGRKNFNDWSFHDFRDDLGLVRGGTRARSLFRPILYDRTCQEMFIPMDHCICLNSWRNLPNDSKEVIHIAEVLVKYINDEVRNATPTGSCALLKFQKVDKAEIFEEHSITRIAVIASPSYGKYQAIVKDKGDGDLEVVSTISRLDSYGNQGQCQKGEKIRPLCYCTNTNLTNSKKLIQK